MIDGAEHRRRARRGRSPCGVASLPGLYAASAINAYPRIQPMSVIVPKVYVACVAEPTAYAKSDAA